MASRKDARTDGCLTRRIWLGGLLLALSACGGRKADPAGPDAGVTPDAPAGEVAGGSTGQPGGKGTVSGGGVGGNGAAGGGGATGRAGEGGTSPNAPAVDISGRWGLFTFEDPVGVQLNQAADGTLTGGGCAAGAPGSTAPGPRLPPFGCGSISGQVSGRTAWFAFPLDFFPVTYRMDVTISTDGRRMTGTFRSQVDAPLDFPVALQRVRDEAEWLDRAPLADGAPVEGSYELMLIPAASNGTEFVAGQTYRFSYRQRVIYGDLGSFWSNEISAVSEGSPLRVGPVPATVPELPTSLALDFTGTGIIGVTATTASGGHYEFSARRMAAP